MPLFFLNVFFLSNLYYFLKISKKKFFLFLSSDLDFFLLKIRNDVLSPVPLITYYSRYQILTQIYISSLYWNVYTGQY